VTDWMIQKSGKRVRHNWSCPVCKKTAYVSPSHQTEGRVCTDCLKQSQRKTLFCKQCGQGFIRIVSETMRSAGSYCSMECYRLSGVKVDRVCGFCGDGFKAYQSQVRKGGAKFCSRSCNARDKLRRALPERRSTAYRVWRDAVFARDKYTCTVCKKKGGSLEAHHIKPWAKYPSLRLEVSNGRTFCVPCHYKFHDRKLSQEGLNCVVANAQPG